MAETTAKRSIVPYGPQHPVLPEPIHLDLVLEDEKIVDVLPNVGFIHRGLEKLVQKKDFNEMMYVIERVCGICSFVHGMGYCATIEKVFDVEIPDRAKFLRTMWSEMSRIHSHMLWLGLLADAFGFESLFYQVWRSREQILNMVELHTGSRLISSVNKVGGVLKDVDDDKLKILSKTVDQIEEDMLRVQKVFFEDYSVQSRLKGIGILTPENAHALGAVGPFARASGIPLDLRMRGDNAMPYIDFEPITSNDCDCYARCYVRFMEVLQSIDIIRQCIAKMPADHTLVTPVKGNPQGEAFMRLEQPRGEVVYYAKANGTKFLDRFRVRTPTFANLIPLCETIKGENFADLGLLVLSIDPCISCTER